LDVLGSVSYCSRIKSKRQKKRLEVKNLIKRIKLKKSRINSSRSSTKSKY